MERYGKAFLYRITILLKWTAAGLFCGAVLGVLGGLFGRSITILTGFRQTHEFMLYLLPIAGLLIVAIYRFDSYHTGTNLILEGVHSGKFVPLRTAPFIVAGTMLTHACGGSAGREGAALQLGGSIGGTLGKLLRFDKTDRKTMIMCGMSAGFSALFGTPLTATVFSMEVVSVGIMQYSALVPCLVASLTASQVAILVGASGEHFEILNMPAFTWQSALMIALIGFLCAFLSIVLCIVLHKSEHLFEKWIKNPWIRIVVGSALIIGLTLLLGTRDYLGAGMNIVEKAIEGETAAEAFILKLVFTAITLGCGFKGGEIVPTLFVGATFGCLVGQILGFSPSLCAACGMIAMFCGVTNCPMSSLFLGFELCGFAGMPFFLIAIGISYLESGHFGLYHSQKLMYSKTRLQFINEQTRK